MHTIKGNGEDTAARREIMIIIGRNDRSRRDGQNIWDCIRWRCPALGDGTQ
jgi:hypothetical protein